MRPFRFAPVWVMFLAGLAAIQTQAFAGEGKDAGSQQCGRWLTRTLDAVESSPMLRRRDIVVAATARACVGVSEALQAAAAAYAKATSEKTKAQLLVNGAAVVLKDNRANCAVADPLARAGALVAKCPMPGPGEKAHPDVLGRMRAADYVFLNALLTSLLASGEYDETAYRLVLQFIISSAQLDESRKGKPRK